MARVEYFVDIDPGFGNGNNVPIVPGLDVTANFQFDINSLLLGFHNLYVRSYINPFQVFEEGKLVTKGGWSLTHSRNFYKESFAIANAALPNVVSGEYFIDTDPGFGSGNNISIIPGNDIANVNFSFDVTQMSVGFHNLYVRFKDAFGNWSVCSVRNFYKEAVLKSGNIVPNIVTGEYFVDTDPGFGNATSIPVVSGNNISNLNFTFDITSFSAGFHNLYVRFKDANGNWSLCSVRNFYKEATSTGSFLLPNITRGEYFIDTDPGHGNAINIPVAAGSDINTLNFTFDVTNMAAGFHNLYVRFSDANGKWSHTSSRNFFKENISSTGNTLPNITGGEFFIDTDPGFGNGNNIPLSPGKDLNNLSFVSDITLTSAGFHNISTRFRDENGQWSHTTTRSFYKEVFTASAILSTIKKVEYFIDTDPGFGNGTSVSFSPATDITSLSFPVNMTNVSIGNHKIYVRAMDAAGKWSLVSNGSFEVQPPSAIYITVGNIDANACAGSLFDIPFAVNTSYGSNNIFTAQLSDGNGNFNNPVNIGSFTGDNSDTIRAIIPSNTSNGNAYRVRILATSPIDTSAVSSTPFFIKRVPQQAFNIKGKNQICVTSENYSTSFVEPNTSYTWTLSGGGLIDTSGAVATATIDWNVAGVHTLTLTSTNSCGIGPIATLPVTVYDLAPTLIPVITTSTRTLSATVINSPSVNGYQWYLNKILIPGAISATYLAVLDGTYTVSYTNTCGAGPASFPVVMITLQDQTINFDTLPSKTFGVRAFKLNANASSGLPVSFDVISGPANISADSLYITGAGIITIRARQAGNLNFNPASTQRTFTVSKAPATITLSNLVHIFDGLSKTATALTDPPGLTVDFLFNNNSAQPINAGGYQIIATINNSNYYGSASDSLHIQKANQTITMAATPDKEFGNQPFNITPVATSGLPVSLSISTNPAGVATLSGNSISILGVGTAIISATQAGNTNFLSANPVSDTFQINKGTQNISFANLPDVTIDSNPITLTATASTGLPVDFSITTNPATGVASVSGNVITVLGDTGTIVVSAIQPGNTFYNSISIQRTFRVLGRSQTISFAPISSKTFGDPSFILNATASSLLPVSYTIVAGAAFVSGNSITIAGTGTVTVEANQGGSDKFNIAPLVRQSFTVNKAMQTISFDTIPGKIFGNTAFVISALSSTGLPVSFSVISGNAIVSTNNEVTITGAGAVIIRASQPGNQNYLPAFFDKTFCIAGVAPPVINGFVQSCISNQQYYIDSVPGTTYTWSLSGGGTLSSNSGKLVSVNWMSTGNHTIIVKATTQCANNLNDSIILNVSVNNPSIPADVSNLFPADATIISSFPLALSWKASGLSQLYDVYIWPEGTLQPGTPFIANLQSVALVLNSGSQLPLFAPGKKYFWKIVTKNACNQSPGVTQSFLISDLPNLVPISLLAPDTSFSGNTIDVTIQVVNNGKVSTGTTRWSDAIYLSRDTILTPGIDLSVGGAPNVSALDVNQGYNTTIRVQLPQNTIGDYNLFFVANGNGELTEVSRLDNTIHIPIQINLTPVPDLQVTSVITPSDAFSGQSINVAYTIKNKGAGQTNAPGWMDYIYISPNPVFDKNAAVKIGEAYHSKSASSSANGTHLLPDSAYTKNLKIDLPAKYFGVFYIFVETDVNDNVYEFSFGNNNTNRSDSINIFLTPPPDFVLTEMVVPTVISSQEIVSINYKVQNAGATKPLVTDRKWFDGIFISKDAVFNINTATLLDYTMPFTRDSILPACPPPPPNNYVNVSGGISSGGSSSGGSSSGSTTKVSFGYTTPNQPVVKNSANTNNSSSGGNFVVPVYCNTQSFSNIQYYNGINPTEGYYLGSDLCGSTQFFYPRMTPSETYDNKISLIIPDSLAGTYYLHLYTDITNTVFEYLQENNNIKVAAINIVNPDLIVDSIDVKDSAASGTMINVAWKVKNHGAGKVFDKNRKDLIWLSQSPVYNPANMIRIDSLTYCSALAADASITKQKPVRIPDGLSGNYYLFVETDYGKNIFEYTQEGNNYLSVPIKINLTSWADLIVNEIQLNKDTVMVDDVINLEYKVTNSGIADLSGKSWRDNVYISNSPSWSYSATKITANLVTQPLPVNGFYTQTLSFAVSGALLGQVKDSTCYFYIKTDGDSSIYEYTKENNNILRSNPLFIKNADLAVSNVTGPATAFSGKTIPISWTVINEGSKTGLFGNNWADYVFISSDTIFNTTDLIVAIAPVSGPLLPGDVYNRTINFAIPNGLTGNYYVMVQSDYGDNIKEKNRINNYNIIRDQNGVPKPIAISLTSSPDLVVEHMASPAIGYSGQPVTVKWRVKNMGAGATLPIAWKESVYLTTDATASSINVNGTYLGSYSHTGNLNAGGFYEDSLQVYIPINAAGNYYLLFVTDNPGAVYEHNAENNNGWLNQLFVIRPDPADLIVTDVTLLPAMLTVGDSITITWKVKNQGVNPANGYFREGVYLSADSIWNVEDVLLANPQDLVYISPFGEKQQQIKVKLSGVKDGKYYAIVRTDLTNNIIETNENNNIGISSDSIAVSMLNLPVNVLTPNVIQINSGLYYKLEIPDSLQGQTMLVSLTANTLITPNELYIRYGDVPTRSVFDYGYENANSGNQDIVIPSLQKGTYYILVFNGSNSLPVNLLAQKIDFAIRSIATNEGGNTGLVTVKIRGAKFEPGMEVKLSNSNFGDIYATKVQYVNSTTIFATFNLAGKNIGQYTVILQKTNNDTTSLFAGFKIIQGMGGGFQGGGITSGGFYCTIKNIGVDAQLGTVIQSPGQVRVGQSFLMDINFGNSGNVDIPLPGRLLVSVNKAPISLTRDGVSEGKTELYLEFKEVNGPQGILRPGATGSITIYTNGFFIGNQTYRLIE